MSKKKKTDYTGLGLAVAALLIFALAGSRSSEVETGTNEFIYDDES